MSSAPQTIQQKLITLLPLLIITVVCFIALFIVNDLTKDKIEINKQRAALAVIKDVLPLEYDNDLFNDKIELAVPTWINNTGKLNVYRARTGEQPVAVSLMPITTKGYGGAISLTIGIRHDGTVTGIKILQHNETEGFGDKVHQDKSDWLQNFNNASIATIPEKQWATKKDDGGFDQLSGATITSRSIINIIYKTLTYYSENRDTFYEN